jgi:drug/metabolite transporter (DMT)-like permease
MNIRFVSTPAGALAAALATVVLWASAFPGIRVALRTFEPVPLASMRFTIAAALMAAWWSWRRPQQPTRADALRLLACGSIGIAGYNVLLNIGQTSVSAGAASFIVNTVPLLTTALAALTLGERVRGWAWLGAVVGFLGVALIASGQPGGLQFGQGASLVFGAAVCQTVFFVLQRPLIARYGAPTCAAAVVVTGALMLLPWLPAGLAQAEATGAAVWPVLYLGVFPAALGYATWATAQAHFGASRAANFLYLVPLVATALAMPLAGEFPGALTLAGGALVLTGVMTAQLAGRRRNG